MYRPGRVALIAATILLTAALPAGCEAQGRQALDDDRLTAMIDSLLPGIAEASGLEVRRSVRHAMQSRAEARSFIQRQLEEEIGLEPNGGMERAYKAFGLIADTLDLRALLLELLTEQVVGYYDPATERLYVVEGSSSDLVGPVVAHELVHALQDQHTSLDSLVAAERGNDRQTAAQAAAEGQAMLVMVALQAAEATGQVVDPANLPDLGAMMRPALEAENAQFPVFQRSPRLIRETLIFPYIGGARFVQALYRHREGSARPVPFGDLLPQSTEQVMDPDRAFVEERDAPTELELGPAGGDWSIVYSNTLGQLELSILLDERLSADSAGAAGWDGDRYALLEDPTGREALIWYAVWDDDAAADRFVAHYERWRANSERTAAGASDPAAGYGPGTIERLEVAGRPVVRVVEVGPGVADEDVGVPPLVSLEERDL